jgi:hypothetical protein
MSGRRLLSGEAGTAFDFQIVRRGHRARSTKEDIC